MAGHQTPKEEDLGIAQRFLYHVSCSYLHSKIELGTRMLLESQYSEEALLCQQCQGIREFCIEIDKRTRPNETLRFCHLELNPPLTSWPKCQVSTSYCFFVIHCFFLLALFLHHKSLRRREITLSAILQLVACFSSKVIFVITLSIIVLEVIKCYLFFNRLLSFILFFHLFTSERGLRAWFPKVKD